MKIVVTGASGFIGSALCRRLGAAMHEVIAVVRSPAATQLNVLPGVTIRCADLSSTEGWDTIVRGADAVAHLGGLAHGRGASVEQLRRVNISGTVHLAQAAARVGARFVFVSTIKVHGEDSGRTPFDQLTAHAPADPYASAKAAAEDLIREISGLRWLVLRPPLVYGPGVTANFLGLLRAIASGVPLPLARLSNRRSLIGLENLCDALERSLCASAGDGACYPICDGAPVSISDLCRAIGDALGRPARLFPVPVALLSLLPSLRSLTQTLEVDDSAFRDCFAWTPPVSPNDGLRATARWFLHDANATV